MLPALAANRDRLKVLSCASYSSDHSVSTEGLASAYLRRRAVETALRTADETQPRLAPENFIHITTDRDIQSSCRAHCVAQDTIMNWYSLHVRFMSRACYLAHLCGSGGYRKH